ncbi:flagellar hook-basal body complex protein FliE [Brachyspira hyodysenteriae]|uniref:Flagellar hook-basal body complex protein FliE n=3 Tax=Brachyspira TaxID=29521 RepID=A0A0G4K7D8_9SPIR|nr:MULTISPECIES: flagellar hook-basal body complex protein FliE [Brachyspira]ACN83335.1 putative flagellar hook-basal body protein FliE [Brachyspira hyodysenteriae WA1]ANN64521.1 flagellar hook-basal body complex protein FliE [Brachyspira hyodysenteriae ATCC 27164]AUJ49071.1 flagellar hook-basal body complex protein FliE [Brachyspira hyodysenteriae]KLI14038.1 flagellar hook-basal body protein FliE [Brachyspira hyodysenteriae]KLI14074.1 flagellar hook-basal body protein FliE [Brachyspira hyodys
MNINNVMNAYSMNNTRTGNVGDNYGFVLKTTDPRHYGPAQQLRRSSSNDLISNFGTMLSDAIDAVNQKQVDRDNIIVQAGIRPDQVDVSDVMNAIAEAELSLSFTKAVIDRAVRAYQEVTTYR